MPPRLLLAALALFSPAAAAAQVIVLDGFVANLGTSSDLREELSSTLRLITSAAPGDSTIVDIGPPLGGSGQARFECWADSLRLSSSAPNGTGIVWIGAMTGERVIGEYLVVAGEATGQGGIWTARAGEAESTELRSRCRGGNRPSSLEVVLRDTEAFRRVRLEMTMLPWESDSMPTEAERAEFAALVPRLTGKATAEMEARGLLPRLEDFLARNDVPVEESAAAAAELVTSGLLRLRPDLRVERFRIQAAMVLGMSDAQCRRWSTLATRFQPFFMMATLDEAALDEFVRWQVIAMEAGMEQRRDEQLLDEDAQVVGLLRLAEILGEEAGPLLIDGLDRYEALPGSARCWLEREMVRGILAAEAEDLPGLAAMYFTWVAGWGR